MDFYSLGHKKIIIIVVVVVVVAAVFTKLLHLYISLHVP